MRILLDTHALMWYNENDASLSSRAFSLINDPANDIFVSILSFYEIAIKINVGKLSVGKSFDGFYQKTIANDISVLPISERYLSTYLNIPLMPEHRDPFDRLILATAIAENLTVVTTDKKFNLYKELVTIVW